MNVTHIKINRVQDCGRMRAIVSVAFDNELAVHDIKVIEGPERLFIAMPSRKMPDGSFRDIVHPINSEMRKTLERCIIEKFLADETEFDRQGPAQMESSEDQPL